MSNKLLMVGASLAQVGGIKTAQKMGFEVIAVDGNPNAPGLNVANKGIVVDVLDHAAIIAIAKDFNVYAATSIASEICLPAVAAVNETCNLPGFHTQQAFLVTNKGKMREKYLENGVPSPRFFIFSKASQLLTAADKVGFPSVLKPVDSSGSKGVSYISNLEELKSHFPAAVSQSKTRSVILEEYMDGPEVSVEAFVINGTIHILTLSDKERTQPPYLLDKSVMFPSAFPDSIQNQIKDVACQAILALGIDNCPIHMEQIVTSQGPKVVELGARGPGFKVYTDIIPHVTGIDPVKVQLQLLKNITPDIQTPKQLKGACIRFWEGTKGRIERIEGEKIASNIEGVEDLEIYFKPGDVVADLKSGADRIGHVITLSSDRSSAVKAAEEVFKTVKIKIKTERI